MSIVAIVGRPNVGKSTFFNRLIQRREAIVDAVSGVTRDRHYGKSDWNGKEFSLIDTGGYVVGSDDIFEAEIDKQVELAIDEADAIIFMVEVESGVTGMDEDVAQLLRKSRKPVFLAVNKVDNSKRAQDAVEFYSLGFERFYTISSINGGGTGDLLDALVAEMPDPEGALRLTNKKCQVKFNEDVFEYPKKIMSPDDIEVEITRNRVYRKTKTESDPVWLVELRVPRKYLEHYDEAETITGFQYIVMRTNVGA